MMTDWPLVAEHRISPQESAHQWAHPIDMKESILLQCLHRIHHQTLVTMLITTWLPERELQK